MKKRILVPLLCAALLLTGCGESTSDAAEIQRQYGLIATAVMEAEVTFHNRGEERCFTLLCDYTPRESTVTVTAPETVAGISAVVTGEEMSLQYGGESFSVGDVGPVNPIAALPQLLRALGGGYLLEQGRESLEYIPCYRLVLDTDFGAAVCTVWIDEETLLPRYAEFAVDGETVLDVNMLSFSCTLQEEATKE